MPPAQLLFARLKALLGNDPKRRILEWEQRGRLNVSLLLGDGAVAAWLAFAFFSFTGRPMPLPTRFAAGVAGAALLAYVVRLHSRPKRLIGGLAIRSAAYAAALGAGLYGLGVLGWLQLAAPAIAWLALAVAVACFTLHVAFHAVRVRHPDQPLEMLRWVILGGAGTALFLPYYHAGTAGTGDAQWYVIMLADFITQLRAGVFPVWSGQSVYAFNGAISPLRFAPWFQHAGGLLDLLTAQALGFGAVSNAVLAVNGLASGFVAYFCLRGILPHRPGLACLLALLPMSLGVLGYVATISYVCLGNNSVANYWNSWMGLANMPLGFLGIPVFAYIARHFGKRHSLLAVLWCAVAVFIGTWWLYTPSIVWLQMFASGLIAFIGAGYWTIMGSMGADVMDYDELECGRRREGSFSACSSWINKFAMAVGAGFGFFFLEWIGFDSKLTIQTPHTIFMVRFLLASIPIIGLFLAMVALARFPLSQQKMAEIRAALEARRGKV